MWRAMRESRCFVEPAGFSANSALYVAWAAPELGQIFIFWMQAKTHPIPNCHVVHAKMAVRDERNVGLFALIQNKNLSEFGRCPCTYMLSR